MVDARRSYAAQARGAGAVWAESICRGEIRRREWAEVNAVKASAIARRLVTKTFHDSRVVDELVPAFLEGAADWWARRPARYRSP